MNIQEEGNARQKKQKTNLDILNLKYDKILCQETPMWRDSMPNMWQGEIKYSTSSHCRVLNSLSAVLKSSLQYWPISEESAESRQAKLKITFFFVYRPSADYNLSENTYNLLVTEKSALSPRQIENSLHFRTDQLRIIISKYIAFYKIITSPHFRSWDEAFEYFHVYTKKKNLCSCRIWFVLFWTILTCSQLL